MWIALTVLIICLTVIITQNRTEKSIQKDQYIKKIEKELELEKIKQENYILENKEMEKELKRIREENNLLEVGGENRFLIKETNYKKFLE